MRVLEALNNLELGGAERLVSILAPELVNAHNCPTAVVCLKGKTGPLIPILENQDIPIFEASRDSYNVLGWVGRLESVLREWKPEVYHTHIPFGLPWQILAARRAGVPKIVITEQNSYQLSKLERIRSIVYDRLYWRYIHKYTCVSESVRQHVSRLRKRKPGDFEVVYNCANIDRFYPDPNRRAKTRAIWGATSDSFVIGSVGALRDQKGFQYLIEAASIVCRQAPQVKFRIFGEGPKRQEFQDQIEGLGLGEKVILEGAISNIEEVLPGLDLFVLPSLWEGLSLAVAEAMATRLPVIATNVGGTDELLAEDSGLIVGPRDPESLSEAILTLFGDSNEQNRLATNAYQRARHVFSIERTAADYVKVFNSK